MQFGNYARPEISNNYFETVDFIYGCQFQLPSKLPFQSTLVLPSAK